jgi:hypothetical protein
MSGTSIYCPSCATQNSTDNAACINCGRPLPRRAQPPSQPPLVMTAAAGGGRAVLESQLLAERAQLKSPGLAAVLGFFFPWAAAFYNGKMMWGALMLGGQIVVALIGIPIGEVPLLLYGIFGAIQNHKWAKQTNVKALEKLVAAQSR